MATLLARYDYRIALGSGVALANLNNVETLLGAHNRMTANGDLFPIGIVSRTVDPFPVRLQSAGGNTTGDGFVNEAWVLTLCTYGAQYLWSYLFSSPTLLTVPVTIYTRQHQLATYTRYNAGAILPSEKNGDIQYIRGNVFKITLNLSDLIAL